MDRKVYCDDAIHWLETNPIPEYSSFVASLPDISEFPNLSLIEWKEWFVKTASLMLSKCPDSGVTVFFQTDIKHEGIWVDKAYLCQKAAELCGHNLLWHKIICRAPVGVTTFGRPAYSHIVCFSKTAVPDIAQSTADVLPEMGEKTWPRGMGLEASLLIAKFIAAQTNSKIVINPFCGEGSMLAAANSMGLSAIGIEKGQKRARKAEALEVREDFRDWK